MNDLDMHNRAAVAAAFRRVSDAATVAAAVFTNPDGHPDEADAVRVVNARTQSAIHALKVMSAARHGRAKTAQERTA